MRIQRLISGNPGGGIEWVCMAHAAGILTLLTGKLLHFKFRIILTELIFSVHSNQIIFSNCVVKKMLTIVRTLTIIIAVKKKNERYTWKYEFFAVVFTI